MWNIFLLFDESIPEQVRSLLILWFHFIYFIIRSLFEIGGIQDPVPLPGDSIFDKLNNRYDIPSYKRVCNEFGINHGLGNIYSWFTNKGNTKTQWSYPDGMNLLFSDDVSKASDGNLLSLIRNDVDKDNKYEYFVVDKAGGLTKAGLSRLNQSIEAFVYCILGAQVNVRSTIVGNSGSAQVVRNEFLILMEDMIKETDIIKSVQRFQLAILMQESKVKLDFAISPNTWLVPRRMVINTESTVGFNNKLKRATPTMKLGLKSEINMINKDVDIKHNLGASKVKLPRYCS